MKVTDDYKANTRMWEAAKLQGMDELLQRLGTSGVRCLLIGRQTIRLIGMPRYSMDLVADRFRFTLCH